jgi:hypothetical protein
VDENKQLTEALQNLVQQLHQVWIEKEACANLAISLGATFAQVEKAKEAALNDPEIQQQTRELFSEMWRALESAANSVFKVPLRRQLPIRQRIGGNHVPQGVQKQAFGVAAIEPEGHLFKIGRKVLR